MIEVPFKMRVFGKRLSDAQGTPAEYRARALALQQHVDRINPYPKPRGFVFKAKTWEDYEAWRRAQSNPRSW